jgi:hypothetical protein
LGDLPHTERSRRPVAERRREPDCDERLHYKEGIIEVRALHLEPGVVVDDGMVAEVKAALLACARF